MLDHSKFTFCWPPAPLEINNDRSLTLTPLQKSSSGIWPYHLNFEFLIDRKSHDPTIINMEVKYCSYRSCKSDNRSYADKPWMEGVWFIPFPKPDTQLEKCMIWVSACGRENFTVEDVNKHTYICSLHFVGGNGPSNEHPHPIAFSQADTATVGLGISKHYVTASSTASSGTRLPFFRYFQGKPNVTRFRWFVLHY